ncbi:MAG: hypothetical protein ACOX28_04530 [Bacilli bacterium]
MKDRISINEWINKFLSGEFDSQDVRVQIQAGWYDWFCKDSSLANKTKKMGNIVRQIKSGGKVNLDNWYVWFKNNCPLNGPLYDDFRFAKLDTGDVQMTIQINCCWNKHRYSVWGRRGEDKEFEHENPLFETDSLKDLVKWFNEPWENC